MAPHGHRHHRLHPATRGRATTRRAAAAEVRRPLCPRGSWPPGSGPTGRARSGSRPPGPTSSGSSRIAGGCRRTRGARRSTASPSTARSRTPSRTRRCCSTCSRATTTTRCTGRTGWTSRTQRTAAPPRLRIGLSTRPPFSGFPSTLHPRIEQALHDVAGHPAPTGTTSSAATRTTGRDSASTSWSGRPPGSTTGARLPSGTTYDRRTDRQNIGDRTRLRRALQLAKAGERRTAARIGAQLEHVDLFLAPTTAQPPLPVEAIDDRARGTPTG